MAGAIVWISLETLLSSSYRDVRLPADRVDRANIGIYRFGIAAARLHSDSGKIKSADYQGSRMLTVFSGNKSKNCDGVSRRDFLSAGSLALGSLTLPQLLATRSALGSDHPYVRDRSVVLLYLSGGGSHIETFDPKMDAPAEIRSVTGSVQTTRPGVHYGGTFPQLANHAHELSIVRSFKHPIGGHEQAHVHVLTGGTDPKGDGKTGFSMGSLASRLRGANHPETGMPSFTLLTEPEIDGQYRKELGRVRKGSRPGVLGLPYSPFEPGAGGHAVENMTLHLPSDRFGDRRALLSSLDLWQRRVERLTTVSGTNKFNEQAVNLLAGGAAKAMDLSTEDPQLVERYDTSDTQIGFKKFRASTLGKQMLMARRLCEAGCGFVTVHSAGWDMHADGNNPGMQVGMEMLGRTMDKAVSTFLDDVKQRGLSDKILLVITGDFGRTPRVNKKGGRAHWARLCTLAFAGGGIQPGQIIGKSSRDGGEPATTPYNASHLMATIMHSRFDMGELRLESQFPRELMQMLEDTPPIQELF